MRSNAATFAENGKGENIEVGDGMGDAEVVIVGIFMVAGGGPQHHMGQEALLEIIEEAILPVVVEAIGVGIITQHEVAIEVVGIEVLQQGIAHPFFIDCRFGYIADGQHADGFIIGRGSEGQGVEIVIAIALQAGGGGTDAVEILRGRVEPVKFHHMIGDGSIVYETAAKDRRGTAIIDKAVTGHIGAPADNHGMRGSSGEVRSTYDGLCMASAIGK